MITSRPVELTPFLPSHAAASQRTAITRLKAHLLTNVGESRSFRVGPVAEVLNLVGVLQPERRRNRDVADVAEDDLAERHHLPAASAADRLNRNAWANWTAARNAIAMSEQQDHETTTPVESVEWKAVPISALMLMAAFSGTIA